LTTDEYHDAFDRGRDYACCKIMYVLDVCAHAVCVRRFFDV